MKKYKIVYRWWFAESTGVAELTINAYSEQRAEERFNKRRYDYPIHSITEINRTT